MNRLFLWLLLSRDFILPATPINFGNERNGNALRVPKVSRFFKWICCSSAVIAPIDTVAPEVLNEESVTIRNYQDHTAFKDIMTLNPEDCDKINDQYKIAFNRSVYGSRNDRFSVLCSYLLLLISEFLQVKDIFTLRTVNRNLLLHHIIFSRFKLYRLLKPQISVGFNLLHESTLSASLLLDPITNLLKRMDPNNCLNEDITSNSSLHYEVETFKETIRSTNNLKDFLFNGLYFLRRIDLVLFFELLEALVKSNIFEFNYFFLPKLKFSVHELFGFACRAGHLCIAKVLLEKAQSSIGENEIYSCLISSIENNHFVIFQLILDVISSNFNVENVKSLLTHSVLNERLEFVRFLFEQYSILALMPHRCLFVALHTKNIELINLILNARGDLDYGRYSTYGLNVLEIAGKADSLEIMELLFQFPSAEYLLKQPRSLRSSIKFKSFDCVKFLLSQFNGEIDEFYGVNESSIFLTEAILSRDIEILKLLLSRIKTKIYDEVCLIYDDGSTIHTNTIQITIIRNFREGFEALIEHFGISALASTDLLGRNSFMVAMTSGFIYYIKRIAELYPESMNKHDSHRNNGLHLLLTLNPSLELIREVSKLEIDWRAINQSGKSPLELLNALIGSFPNEDFSDILNNIFIFSNIEK